MKGIWRSVLLLSARRLPGTGNRVPVSGTVTAGAGRTARQFFSTKLAGAEGEEDEKKSKHVPENPAVVKKEWVRPTSEAELSVLGKQYNAILYKGRGGRDVGLADLRKLLQACTTADDVRFAVKGVEYYQKKGNDFAEDVASLLIKACVSGGNPMAAAYAITKVSVLSLFTAYHSSRRTHTHTHTPMYVCMYVCTILA